jgi:hypothetical protein
MKLTRRAVTPALARRPLKSNRIGAAIRRRASRQSRASAVKKQPRFFAEKRAIQKKSRAFADSIESPNSLGAA